MSAICCWAMPRSASREPKSSRRARPGQRDVVSAPGRAEPAHAVGQPGGREPDLGVGEAAADLAQHRVVGTNSVAQLDRTVPADGRRVDGAQVLADLPARVVRVDQEHRRALGCADPLRGHDDRERRAVGAGDQVLVAVDDPAAVDLPARPSRSAAGSDPAPGAGSVMAKHERTVPSASGRR